MGLNAKTTTGLVAAWIVLAGALTPGGCRQGDQETRAAEQGSAEGVRETMKSANDAREIDAWRAALKRALPDAVADPAQAARALAVIDEAIESARTEHGKTDPRIAIAYGMRAAIQEARLDWSGAAESRVQQIAVLEAMGEAADARHSGSLASSLAALHRSYVSAGALEQARQVTERAIAAATAEHRADSAQLGLYIAAMAAILEAAQAKADAAALYRRALAVYEQGSGVSPGTLDGVRAGLERTAGAEDEAAGE